MRLSSITICGNAATGCCQRPHVTPTPCLPPCRGAAAAHGVAQAAAAGPARPPAAVGLAAAGVRGDGRGAGAQLGAGRPDCGEWRRRRRRGCVHVCCWAAASTALLFLVARQLEACACLPADDLVPPSPCPGAACPAQVRIISFGVTLFLPMTILGTAVLLPVNYTSGGQPGLAWPGLAAVELVGWRSAHGAAWRAAATADCHWWCCCCSCLLLLLTLLTLCPCTLLLPASRLLHAVCAGGGHG